jgi:hypothetical protein
MKLFLSSVGEEIFAVNYRRKVPINDCFTNENQASRIITFPEKINIEKSSELY